MSGREWELSWAGWGEVGVLKERAYTVLKDTMVILPNSYTRIGFNIPAASGLYTWLR
jgi:hypothetical protein